MEYFKIPCGINKSGEVVFPKDAKKEEDYSCIFCTEKVVFKENGIEKEHFSHPHNSYCNLESMNHLLAKKLLVDAIKKNAEGKNDISLINECSECSKKITVKIPKGTFSKSEIDVPVSEYIFDVVACRDDKMSLGIRILQFINTSDYKYKAESLSIHWILINPDDIIKDSFTWNPISYKLIPRECDSCKEKRSNIIAVAKRWGIDSSFFTTQKNPKLAKYIAAVTKCFNCKCEIPVFWWSGVPFSQVKPPDPMPYTIEYRNSQRFGDSYYMNTCPNCKKHQGDNFLYLKSGAPFEGLPIRTIYNNETSILSEALNFLGLNKF